MTAVVGAGDAMMLGTTGSGSSQAMIAAANSTRIIVTYLIGSPRFKTLVAPSTITVDVPL